MTEQGWLDRLLRDGPRLSLVVFVFTVMQVLAFGGSAARGLAILAPGLVVTAAVARGERGRGAARSVLGMRDATGHVRQPPPERPRRVP